MTAYSGRAGKFVINDGADKIVGQCTEWSLDIATDTEEITAFGSSGWKDRMYMMSSWSGSATVKWDVTDAGQAAIQTKMLTPAQVSVKLYTDATHNYTGNAFLKSWSVKTAANGIIESEVQFDGTGAVTYS